MSGGLADGDAGSGGAGDATSDGDGKEDQMKAGSATSSTGAGAKGKWEDTREARERGLKERKERMILEARRWVCTRSLHPYPSYRPWKCPTPFKPSTGGVN